MPQFASPRPVAAVFLAAVVLFIVPLDSQAAAISKKAEEAGQAQKPAPGVEFALDHPASQGSLDPGKPLDLVVYLTGVAPGRYPIVAIFEGEPFVRRLVPMMPDANRSALRSMVTLEPYFSGVTSPREKALRIRVTFARLRGMRLDRFLTRAVYLTFALPLEAAEINTAPFSEDGRDPLGGARLHSLTGVDDLGASGDDSISEQDLPTGPAQGREQGYWKLIGQLVSRSWSGRAGDVTKKDVKRPVKVRFQLYANGDAQLVHVERSSGSHAMDDAGMLAIVGAHPFPPFPPTLEIESVDLHVELDRSGRARHKSVRPASVRAGSSGRKRP